MTIKNDITSLTTGSNFIKQASIEVISELEMLTQAKTATESLFGNIVKDRLQDNSTPKMFEIIKYYQRVIEEINKILNKELSKILTEEEQQFVAANKVEYQVDFLTRSWVFTMK